MMRLAVEDRVSTVVGRSFSLSVQLRLVRPLRKIAERGSFEVIESTTDDLLQDGTFNFDLLFMSRPKSVESLRLVQKAREKRVPTVVDIDDWMYGIPKYGEPYLHKFDSGLMTDVLEATDVLTLPTLFFSQVMLPLFAGPINVLPYGFDFSNQDASPMPDGANSQKIILSSMFTLKLGSRLFDFAEGIKRFLGGHPGWIVDLYGENLQPGVFEHPRINVMPPVAFEDYLQILRTGQYAFAVVPLAGYEDAEDLLFNACKSPLKFIDYSANHIPGIYSRTPVFESVIANGSTGLLVDNTADDWYHAMSQMASDVAFRKMIAARGYEDVRTRFSLERSVAALKEVVECAIG